VFVSPTTPEINSLILYSDDQIVIVNKPAGLLSIPDGYDPTLPSLSGIMRKELGEIWIVHRLDKDTSGAILFARTAEVHRDLNIQFTAHKVQKIYHALVEGSPAWTDQSVSSPLKVNGDRRHRTVVNYKQGKPAKTEFTVIEKFEGVSLIAGRPKTGYTHQIRVHLSSIGYPILVDHLYNHRYKTSSAGEPPKREAECWINRLALHAFQLTFQNLITNIKFTIQAPYPDDFQIALERLRGLKNNGGM
jgi:tRNA pseudouridine32 synthase / 23S rRNA pseudouridine746 synthase